MSERRSGGVEGDEGVDLRFEVTHSDGEREASNKSMESR